MPVYVDNMRAPYGRMIMCHMTADTLEELHAMADTIGIKRRWFQQPPKASHPHYDISLGKRALAIKNGAKEIRKYALLFYAAKLNIEWGLSREQTNPKWIESQRKKMERARQYVENCD